MESVRLPSRSPNLNAYAERFVRSVRDECLSKLIPLGGKHLRELLREYGAHDHGERNHQGIANALSDPSNDKSTMTGGVKRIGGMLNFCHRADA